MRIHVFPIISSILIFVFISLLISCDYRTPSRIRFSKICDIDIPKGAEVIKDEYQDMLQDYAIIYEIKLNREECEGLTKSIRNSAYYNSKVCVTKNTNDAMFIDSLGKKAVWAKSESGYIFANKGIQDSYSVQFDTIRMIARFSESHD